VKKIVPCSWLVAAAVLATAASPAFAGPGKDLPVDLELVIAVDVSASMDKEEFALQREGYVDAVRHPDFVAAVLAGDNRRIALTYMEWSGAEQQTVVVPWRLIDSRETAEAFADELAGRPVNGDRGTSISGALAYGTALFDANAFDGARRVIDISGDGPNNFGPSVTAARDAAVASGVVINGLPILIRPSPIFPAMDRYYQDCVIGGPGAFVLPVRRAEEFALAIRRKLILEVAGIPSTHFIRVAATAPVDCLIGDRIRKLRTDEYLPGLGG
jgi:Protein of unknown function (DUF1194)